MRRCGCWSCAERDPLVDVRAALGIAVMAAAFLWSLAVML